MDSVQRLTLGWVVAVLLAAWYIPVSAQALPATAGVSVTPFPLRGNVAGRTIMNAPGGGVLVDDLIKGRVGAANADMFLKRSITARALAGGIARAALGPAGIVTGVAIAAAIEAARCKAETGSYLCDAGVPAPQITEECWDSGTVCLSKQEAINKRVAGYMASTGAVNCGVTYGTSTPTLQQATLTIWFPSYGDPACDPMKARQRDVSVGLHRTQAGAGPCPNGGATGPDGKCPSGVYQPATPDDVGEKIEQKIAENPAQHLQDSLNRGDDLSTVPSSPAELTGPATVAEPVKTTTTTSPQGLPQTTTTQVTHHITYAGDTFNYTTTTINNYPDGTTEETSETPEDKPSDCEADPSRLGCLPAGQAPELEVSKRDIPVTFSPDAGFGADGGGCPSNQSFSVLGQPVEVDLSLVCQYLVGIRFAVVGVAGVVASIIFLGGLRK